MKLNDISLISLIFYLIFSVHFFLGNHDNLEIHIFDVGQGDAILIKAFSKEVLVDGGDNFEVDRKINRYLPFYNCSLDAVYLTHPHKDHMLGLTKIMSRCKIKSLMFNDVDYTSQLFNDFKELGRKYNSINSFKGDELVFDNVLIKTFWPEKELSQAAENVNNVSIVVLLDYGNFEALFLGDLESDFQEKIDLESLKQHIQGRLDVVKIAHHGAKNGLNKELLTTLKPRFCVISVGKDNKFGHPSQETLDFLTQIGCKILRTDEKGDINFVLKTD